MAGTPILFLPGKEKWANAKNLGCDSTSAKVWLLFLLSKNVWHIPWEHTASHSKRTLFVPSQLILTDLNFPIIRVSTQQGEFLTQDNPAKNSNYLGPSSCFKNHHPMTNYKSWSFLHYSSQEASGIFWKLHSIWDSLTCQSCPKMVDFSIPMKKVRGRKKGRMCG